MHLVQVMAMIAGEKMAPWEDPQTAPEIVRKLGHIKSLVLRLLERNPERRMSVVEFQRGCHRMISNTTVGV